MQEKSGAYANEKRPFLSGTAFQTVKKPLGCVEGPQPFDFESAAGDMCGGEEQKDFASYINLRP